MMNRMFGLPAGACAKAGKVIADKLTAAKAAVETSIRLKLLLILIAPAPNFQIVMRERKDFSKSGERLQETDGVRRRLSPQLPASYRGQPS
jgi:hypothetical protein